MIPRGRSPDQVFTVEAWGRSGHPGGQVWTVGWADRTLEPTSGAVDLAVAQASVDKGLGHWKQQIRGHSFLSFRHGGLSDTRDPRALVCVCCLQQVPICMCGHPTMCWNSCARDVKFFIYLVCCFVFFFWFVYLF